MNSVTSRAASEPRAVATALVKLGVPVPAGVAEGLARHLALVAEWNRAYNLTAVRDPAEMIARHILDSAAALPFLRGRRMLDAGSGAGFPGIVLALLAPETSWVLVEANGKKARFLRHAVRQLDLSERVSVVQERLENYRPEGVFDTITARALADLGTLAGWTASLLSPAGRLVALKGRRNQIEAECSGLAAGWRVEITAVKVPDLAAERHIVVLERTVDA